jgi:D-arabinose 1-dehydrogenase-like Zn-dependent alcohol dehydrogenase
MCSPFAKIRPRYFAKVQPAGYTSGSTYVDSNVLPALCDALMLSADPDRLTRLQGVEPAAELLKLGGAKVILATVTSGEAMSAVQGGLAVNGTLLILGAAGSLEVSPVVLIRGSRSIKGWYSGTSIDSQDTLSFSVQAGVRSMNEVFPLERVAEAYERMLSGKARFRVVLTMGN